MTKLYEEMARRFPEIRDRLQQDTDFPYLMMGSLAHWLEGQEPQWLTSELGTRVIAFTKWCEEQPRGDNARDDLLTILVVGFYEELFKLPRAGVLLPKLIPREDIVRNEDYFKTWVGEEAYAKALSRYDANH